MADPVSASLAMGGAGLLMQNDANNKARKDAKKAGKGQRGIAKRQVELFDDMLGIIQRYEASGGFDPQAQIDQLGKDTEHYASRDMGNSASNARALGYRPGDTAPVKAIRSIDSKHRLQYGQAANQIRQNAFTQQLGAYSALQGGQGLNNASAVYGQQQQQAQSQIGGFGNLLASMQPFLQAKPSQPKAVVNTGGPYNIFNDPNVFQGR